MPLFEGFVAGSNRARSSNISADECINIFPEITQSAANPKHGTFYGTPGLKFFLTAGTVGCRGIFSQDDLTVTVIGQTVYVVDVPNATVTSVGTIATDGKPVSMACNGRGGEQLVIVGGGQLKVLTITTRVLSAAIVLPLTKAPVQVDYMDGYFLLSEADSIKVYFSALEDGTGWDALDFFAVSLTSSNVVGIKVMRDRLWVFQSLTSLVYYDSGDADNPFVPYPGSVMEEGAVTPWAILNINDTMYWLAQDSQGTNRIVAATDYSPSPITTPAVSSAIASYTTTTDCEAMAYSQEGHDKGIWTFPSGDSAIAAAESWCYDVSTGQWHQVQGFDEAQGAFVRWRARGCGASGKLVIVGDYLTGTMYTLDLDTFEDNGTTIKRLRRAPYLSAENQWIFLDRLELGIQSGVGLQAGQGSDPMLMLSLSRDGGHTYDDPITAPMGGVGEYGEAAIWYQLGRSRADRLVIEVSQTDPVRTVWGPGVWVKVRPGTGAL